MAAGLAAGNIVEIDNLLTAYLPTNALRTITTFTATAAQTTFSVSYTQGLIDVFYNGSNLAQSEYTATNGTSIILATACQLNDIVVVYAYSYSVGAYSGIGGGGTINTIPKFTASSTIGDSAITDNGTTVTLVARALSGTSASFTTTGNQLTLNGSGNSSPASIRMNGTTSAGANYATAIFQADAITGGSTPVLNIQTINAAGSAFVTALSINTSQNVGIGTNNPSAKFEVAASGAAAEVRINSNNTADNNPALTFYSAYSNASERNWGFRTSIYQLGDFGIFQSASAGTSPFAGTNKFYISGGGNVLIGSTTDDTANKLQVSGSGAFTSNLKVSGKTFTTTAQVSVPNATATTVYTMSSGQGIGILTISPASGGTTNAAYTAICTIGTIDTNYNLLNATLGTANITITRSGANIQVTHAIGSSTTFNVTYLSLQN
jgi:hypothetical protein